MDGFHSVFTVSALCFSLWFFYKVIQIFHLSVKALKKYLSQ